MELRQRALEVLRIADPDLKSSATLDMYAQAAQFSIDACGVLDVPAGVVLPGHPAKPELLHHTAVGRRSPATPEGRATLMHAIAHIEFNAINLALDAIWRFADMPEAFYLDWLRVAGEEAKHFRLLRDHLRTMGYDYGDFPAHQGLWTMCEKTAHDIVARMALVPRTMEARGLDATPLIQKKLRQIGAPDAVCAASILDIILEEEVDHVAIGNRWYFWLCERDGLDAQPHFFELMRRYEAPRPKPPLNTSARLQAGFTETELEWLLQPERLDSNQLPTRP
ncbi:ferritin-like domain-containing protein [Diaphorobacter sp.]|uniref:ferritin-like domain-containing protein n=1 Tax=Diaphorobacter sp. TaxID=1934310 RepID=UPI0028A798F3|nr:ferritin-like domain-containing protein [Diaphorobacter sp.]